MKNLGQLMKQAQEMQEKMAEMQGSLVAIEIEGVAGAGLVTVVLNGKGEMQRLRVQEETQKLMGGLPLPPGMKFPF